MIYSGIPYSGLTLRYRQFTHFISFFILTILSCQGAIADENIEDYIPPAMFDESHESSKNQIVRPAKAYKRGMPIHGDILLAPRKVKPRPKQRTEAPFKPPIPPRRPVKFSVSQEYLDSLSGKKIPRSIKVEDRAKFNQTYDMDVREMSVEEIYSKIE